ncbi:MAG: penicillin-binding protein 1B [Gammaproteobacteria bacterium]|nr:penicillin-binding protein 1B [Gammaproteobacteria bacterium]
MARLKYDEDDLQPDAPRSPWRRRVLVWALALVGLGLGFLVPYTLYLNSLLGEQFASLTWQEPTRVYARPLVLAPGLALDGRTLGYELQAAGYREGDGVAPGTWRAQEDGGRWLVSSRGFRDIDGAVAPARIEVRLAGGRVSRLRDADGRALERARLDPARIATLYGGRQEERRMVRLEDVPVLLTDALQAVEDRDFAHHRGIDLGGMARAAWVNLRAGATRQGGSTLTQQLARSGLFGIGREQTWSRKFNEIIYALLMEARYDKATILETYLNQVYVGQRGAQAIRGVAAGAEFWFGRRLEDLEAEHVALLVGLIRGPSYYDPRRHPERARERRDFALAQMHSTGLLDEEGYRRALAAPLGVTDRPGSLAVNRFPAYVDLVLQQLASDYDPGELQGAGLSVMTAMSPSAQGYAEGAVRGTIESLGEEGRPELQAAVVLTDVHSGEVLAVVGNRDPLQHGFNRAIDAKRPVGSLLKPFVYLLALALPGEWSLATPIDDSPVTVTLPNGRSWSPANADRRSHGTVPLMDALARSYNQATVRLGMQIDPRRLAELIGTLAGIEAQPNPSLILGSLDQSPYAMAQLYQFLASGGEFQALRLVRGVIDDRGVTVNRYDHGVGEAQAGDAMAVRLVTLALQRAVTSGTARQLVNDGLGHLQAAGKTGTSNDGRDSWFAGWTGDHLAVVWMGNDQNEATGLYGATGAMRVWSDMFSRLPSAPLEVGDGDLDWRWVAQGHSTDADCPQARRFAFVPGFAPAYQPCHYVEPGYSGDGPVNAGVSGTDPARRPARRGWRSWFGLDEPEPDEPRAPAHPEPPSVEP